MKNTKTKSTATLIVNPVSGTGNPKERRELLIKNATEMGWNGAYIETTKSNSAYAIAKREVKKGVKHLIICGGDGTVMEVLTAVLQTKIVIGIVPLGTGNLLARNVDLPLTVSEAMEIALHGKEARVDVGKANGTVFSIMAGIGLDAQIMQGANRKMKDRLGFMAYVLTGLKKLQTHAKRYEITIDEKKPFIVRAKTIMVANMGKMMGGVEIVPRTHPQSGKLQVGILKARTGIQWLSISFHALTGKIDKSPHFDVYEAKKVTIKTITGKNYYQCDGNHFPQTDLLTIDIYPKAVTVLLG
jgi:YegS/Rv2252/BmrU family lipid kinase